MDLGSLRANIVGEVVVGYSSGPGLSHSIDRGGIGRRVIVVGLSSLTAHIAKKVVVGL